MTKYQFIRNFLFLITALLVQTLSFGQDHAQSYPDLSDKEEEEKGKALMLIIQDALSQVHYAPVKLDDEFSEKAYGLYIERLDYGKRFFLAEDVKEFEKHKKAIDDQIQSGSYELFDLTYELMDSRLAKVKNYYQSILNKPFDFTKDEIIESDGEKLKWAKNTQELKDRWRKILKYDALIRIVDKLEEQEKEGFEGEKKSFKEIEKDVREKIKKNYDNWYDRLDKLDKEDRRSIYLNSIINVYGPHTSYFPPADKENFDISMSGQLEGIGARLTDTDGYITVSEIVPGSPSSLQGELEAKDKILEVAQDEEEPVNIEGAQLEDAVKIIRGKKGTGVTLTVRKLDGSKKKIRIIRDVVLLEETYAKSVKLKHDGQNIGYIKLPKFYADFGKGGASCSRDVKEEIEKLKAENIEGLVLDLRDNGGGSLREAIDMAGLFIESGPIVQVKSSGDNRPMVYSDLDKGITYDGPLVILLNEFSASASEILAAAIQDYGRGVIVGSSSSFGKGTVQRFFGLDDALSADYDHLKPLGSIKITTQKFYQINGGTTQLKGVSPDIVLPDDFMFIEVGEKEQDYALEWDEIEAASYDKWKNAPDLDLLKKNSEQRVSENTIFQLIEEDAQRLKDRSDKTTQSLLLDTYRAEKKKFDEESEKYKKIREEIEGLEIITLKDDLAKLDDEKSKKLIDVWYESISKDVYILEAMKILGDM